MKYLSRFNESTINPIVSICQKYHIKNYTINMDGSIDVDGDVNLHYRGLTELPLKFRNVTGYFMCNNNELTSLEGCPRYVGGKFECNYNNFLTLEGGPERVEGNYWCSFIGLESLKGAPEYVGDDFRCMNNNLESLEYSPKYIGGNYYCHGNRIINVDGITDTIGCNLYCLDNPIYNIFELFNSSSDFLKSMDYSYLRGRNIDKVRFEEACSEFGVRAPKKIYGYKYI